MQWIDVTAENIDREHICCSLTKKKDETCIEDKKAWLAARFDDGLTFRKLAVRGKVFIEYIPAEKAWFPVIAPGYLHIDCLWVAGQYKRQGYATTLLQACIDDARAQGKAGITAVSTVEKSVFLMDGKFFKHHGFQVADIALPQYELLYLPLAQDAPKPAFRDTARSGRTEEMGAVVYYTDQCPYTNTYAKLAQEAVAKSGRTLTLHKFETAEQAQGGPSPIATYGFFYNGAFVTNEVLTPASMVRYLEEQEGHA